MPSAPCWWRHAVCVLFRRQRLHRFEPSASASSCHCFKSASVSGLAWRRQEKQEVQSCIAKPKDLAMVSLWLPRPSHREENGDSYAVFTRSMCDQDWCEMSGEHEQSVGKDIDSRHPCVHSAEKLCPLNRLQTQPYTTKWCLNLNQPPLL